MEAALSALICNPLKVEIGEITQDGARLAYNNKPFVMEPIICVKENEYMNVQIQTLTQIVIIHTPCVIHVEPSKMSSFHYVPPHFPPSKGQRICQEPISY